MKMAARLAEITRIHFGTCPQDDRLRAGGPAGFRNRVAPDRRCLAGRILLRVVCLLMFLALARTTQARIFVTTNSTWRYFKGISEASTPTNAWRELDFDDSAWQVGTAPFHFGTNSMGGDDNQTGGTILTDMRSNYTCVFLRQTFVVEDTNAVAGLWLNFYYDDGLAVWINGQPPRSPVYANPNALAHTNTASTATREANFLQRVSIAAAVALLRPGTNVLCVQALNGHLNDEDFRIDVELAETPSAVQFALGSYSIGEDAGWVDVRVVRIGALDAAIKVDYTTVNGTAVAGLDYTATNGTLDFAPGEGEKVIRVPILNDGLWESNESFQLKLSNPVGASLGTPSTAALAILDAYSGLPHFTKVTTGAIVNDLGDSYGCAWGDYDGDGYIDLVVGNGSDQGTGKVYLYRNLRDGTFQRVSGEPFDSLTSWFGSCNWGDYDNDGNLDLYVANNWYFQLLCHNNGDGTFTRVAGDGGVNNVHTHGASWGDYDNDGYLDLFGASSWGGDYTKNSLYHNNRNGTFTKVLSPPIATDQMFRNGGVVWGDYDNDGDLDIVLGGGNAIFQYRNEGEGSFSRIMENGLATNTVMGGWGALAPVWGDYDNDGLLDLFVSSLDDNGALFHNVGNGNFAKTVLADTADSCVGAWGDYDNDGWLDLFVGRGYYGAKESWLFRNNGDGTLSRINSDLEPTRSFGCAWGDYDNDGFLDLYIARLSNQANLLYHNNGNTNRWITFKLEGNASNRSAIGAKVRILATIAGKRFWQMREISGGGWGQDDMRPHFGLGDATHIETARIEWPSGQVTVLHELPANQFVSITEPPFLQCLGMSYEGLCLRLTARQGSTCELAVSTNMVHWEPWQTVEMTERVVSLVDYEALSERPQRFYKAAAK